MTKSKSAYSVAGKKGKLETHIIVVWVDNEAGVLARVVGLFSGRGYNIESLAVAEIDSKKNISRVTIVTTGLSYEGSGKTASQSWGALYQRSSGAVASR